MTNTLIKEIEAMIIIFEFYNYAWDAQKLIVFGQSVLVCNGYIIIPVKAVLAGLTYTGNNESNEY